MDLNHITTLNSYNIIRIKKSFPFIFHRIPYIFYSHLMCIVICFQLQKYYYAETINRAVRLKDTQFSRAEFLIAFDYIRA
jgi:hypothetical protein